MYQHANCTYQQRSARDSWSHCTPLANQMTWLTFSRVRNVSASKLGQRSSSSYTRGNNQSAIRDLKAQWRTQQPGSGKSYPCSVPGATSSPVQRKQQQQHCFSFHQGRLYLATKLHLPRCSVAAGSCGCTTSG